MNSLKVPKIKKLLLHEMKFLVPNYSCLQNPWLGGYCPQISILCPLSSTEFVELRPRQNSWVRHWMKLVVSFTQTPGIECKEAVRAPQSVWICGEEKNLLPLSRIELVIVQHKA